MLIYRLRDRILKYEGAIRPTFPSEAVVQIRLAPAVPFGGVPGVTRNAISDRPLKARANLSTGKFVIECATELFDPVAASVAIADTDFSISKNVARVQSRCTSEQDLVDLIAAIYHAFPAVLNVYLPDAPYATHVWGTVGNVNFQWLFEPTEVRGNAVITSKQNQERLITDSWRQVKSVASSRRLMGALHYFYVGCRLLECGHNRFEFMAETLLNFAKCLQSAFGESRDDTRRELVKLGEYSEAEIEARFITALALRDEFDIAHVSLARLTRDQLRVLHAYTHLAEDAFRKFMRNMLRQIENGSYELPPDGDASLSTKKRNVLMRVAENIKDFIS